MKTAMIVILSLLLLTVVGAVIGVAVGGGGDPPSAPRPPAAPAPPAAAPGAECRAASADAAQLMDRASALTDRVVAAIDADDPRQFQRAYDAMVDHMARAPAVRAEFVAWCGDRRDAAEALAAFDEVVGLWEMTRLTCIADLADLGIRC